jgi:hypothetical protein
VFHESVAINGSLIVPFAGERSVGCTGGVGTVVKLKMEENEPVPPGFLALTLQKYFVLVESELSCFDVVAIVESSKIMEVKSVSVAACNLYVTAPAEAFHESVAINGSLIVPFAGESSVGCTGGGGTVVKLKMEENELVPPGFLALTRQKYFVLVESEPSCLDVVAIVESSKIIEVKRVSVAACNLYATAPAEKPQESVGFRG